jgi:hypothetical protein
MTRARRSEEVEEEAVGAPRPGRPQAADVASVPVRGRLTPATLLALQRGAGNAAVARALAQREPVDDAGPAGVQDALEPEPDGPAETLETRFPLDADGDGELETKRLFIDGEGAGARLMINPEPVLFETFLKNNPNYDSPTVGAIVRKIRTLMKKPIGLASGAQIEGLLEALAADMQANFQVERPPSQAKTWATGVITDKQRRFQERVTTHLIVEPLSHRPGPQLTGTGVQDPNTPFMAQLRKFHGYVRGHMLNSKLHGPGIDDNLVPISSTFNAAMKNGVEQKLKELVSSQNLVVSYEIQPTGWGGYQGTKQAPDLENALPTGFTMRIRPMELRSPLIDGRIPGNWKPTGATLDYTATHGLPASQRFDESGAPHRLRPGVWVPVDAPILRPNTTMPGTWVFQGLLEKQHFTGQEGKPWQTFDPVNISGESSASAPLPLIQVGGALIVQDAVAAQQGFAALKYQRGVGLGLLGDRLAETQELLTRFGTRRQEIAGELLAWSGRSDLRLAELREKGLDADGYASLSGTWRRGVEEAGVERLGRYERIRQAHEERRTQHEAVTTGWAQYIQQALDQLVADPAKFWAAQDAREERYLDLDIAQSRITFPNREAFYALKDLLGDAERDLRGLGTVEQREQDTFRAEVRRWQPPQAPQPQHDEDMELPQEYFALLENIKLPEITPEERARMDADMQEALRASAEQRGEGRGGRRGASTVMRRQKDSPRVLALLDETGKTFRRGAQRLEAATEARQQYDAWARRHFETLKQELRGLGEGGLTRRYEDSFRVRVERERDEQLTRLGAPLGAF